MARMNLSTFFWPWRKKTASAKPAKIRRPLTVQELLEVYFDKFEPPEKYDAWSEHARNTGLVHKGGDPE